MHGDAVHRSHLGLRAAQRHPPVRPPDAVQHAQGDERIQFVEALEGEDGDVHGRGTSKCPASCRRRMNTTCGAARPKATRRQSSSLGGPALLSREGAWAPSASAPCAASRRFAATIPKALDSKRPTTHAADLRSESDSRALHPLEHAGQGRFRARTGPQRQQHRRAGRRVHRHGDALLSDPSRALSVAGADAASPRSRSSSRASSCSSGHARAPNWAWQTLDRTLERAGPARHGLRARTGAVPRMPRCRPFRPAGAPAPAPKAAASRPGSSPPTPRPSGPAA